MDKHGDLDGFWLVLTGGDGRHIWFAAPSDVAIRCSAGQVGPGLDVRGDGGYVVAPPSNHASGQRYRWHPEHNPLRGELAPPPPWLVRAMTLAPAQRGGRFGTAAPVVGPIPEGRRDTTLASLAGSMRNRGLSPDEMLPSLRAVNARCVPPLDERDLERIARSIGRYRPPILLVS
jgi:putative DNA primase/helicase